MRSRCGAQIASTTARPTKAPADLSSVNRGAGSPASSTTLLSEPLTPKRTAAETTITRPLRTAVSLVCAGTTASTIRGPYPRRRAAQTARLDVPMAGVVVEGAALDLVTLAALGVIAPRLDVGVPADATVVALLDPEGAPLATLSVDPGSGAGTLSDLRRPEHGPFSSWVRRPGELPLVGGLVFIHEPPTAEQLDALVGRPVVLVPLVGHGRHGVLGRDAL